MQNPIRFLISVFTGLALTAIMFLSAANVLHAESEKGLVIISGTNTNSGASISDEGIKIRLNTADAFRDVVPRKTCAFLVGNDGYSESTGFPRLNECYSDVRLLKQILIHCCKVDEKNIAAFKDLTLDGFKKSLSGFIDGLDKDCMVIIAYSGHGDTDGSLVFVDGGRLPPRDLRAYVNSFRNDTVILVDACYSGNNEGPKELFKTVKEEPFKYNSLRIYAALAHMSAREIEYGNIYFKSVLPFYRDVLGLTNIGGNGYFTAMIGLFFASYKFGAGENISFPNLVSYMSGKGKEYVEYLASRGISNQQAALETVIRLNQVPKIMPMDEEVTFLNQDHKYLFLQKTTLKSGYQVKVTLSGIAYREDGAKYRVEMQPYGTVSESTNLVVDGKKDYTMLVYNETRGQLVFSNQYFIDGEQTIRLEDKKWGGPLHFNVFTGMGFGGAGIDYFFMRKLSAGISICASYYPADTNLNHPSYTGLGFICDLNYYLFGDQSYDFRLLAGVLGYISTSVVTASVIDSASHAAGNVYNFSFDGGGIGLQAGIEFSILFLKAGLVYTFLNNTQGFYPAVRLGIRL